MAVGAFAAYNFMLRVPGMPILVAFVLAGVCAALVGIVFGLPSLRIKGFYLAVATLAAQFFVVWCADQVRLVHQLQHVRRHHRAEDRDPRLHVRHARWRSTCSRCRSSSCSALAAKNMVRSNVGRAWMAVRDMDVAAEVIGIRLMPTKLLAFAVSSFYCGVAGALYAYAYLGTVEPEGVQPRPVVPHPVHGHHRRRRQHPRLVPRRGVHRAAADLPATRSRRSSRTDSACTLPAGSMSQPGAHGVRRR